MSRSGLTALARDVLAMLPTEPDGISLAALAQELLGRRDPLSRGKMSMAIGEISQVLGSLAVGRGDDEDLGRFKIPVYGLRRTQLAAARAMLSIASGEMIK